MNELITNSQRMTSLEIAELSGKNHKDVMRAIRNMEDAWEKVNGRNFALVEYKDVKGELRPCYNLTKTECADDCVTITDIAKAIGMETEDLNSFLVDRGIQRWSRGQFRLTENYEGQGLAQDRLFIYYSKDGKQRERTYLVWTLKGADLINSLF